MSRQNLTIVAVAAFALSVSPRRAAQRSSRRQQFDSAPRSHVAAASRRPRRRRVVELVRLGVERLVSSGSTAVGSPSLRGAARRGVPSERRRRCRQRRRSGRRRGRPCRADSGASGGTTRRRFGTSSSASSNDSSGDATASRCRPIAVRATDAMPPERRSSGTGRRRGDGGGGGGGGVYYPGVIYDPYYYGYGYYDPYYGRRYSSYWSPFGYGYGLGLLRLRSVPVRRIPYGWPAYDPYGSSYGSGGLWRAGATAPSSHPGETGSIRLKVKPNNAQVFVDGYYVGAGRQLRRHLPEARHRGRRAQGRDARRRLRDRAVRRDGHAGRDGHLQGRAEAHPVVRCCRASRRSRASTTVS